MTPTSHAYLTGCGAFLPGDPIGNDEVERRLGGAGGRSGGLRSRVLAMNGIQTRHYALDGDGATTMLNEELAAAAVWAALADRGLPVNAVGMLATGTTQGDLLVPGFASMVHGRLGGGPMQVLAAGGVCGSSMAALDAVASKVRLGEHRVGVAVGSELISRALKTSRFAESANGRRPSLDAEFLRWTLSDGAGAVVVEPQPRPSGCSLRLDWTHLVSYAHEHAVCMRAGVAETGRPGAGDTWLDQPSVALAAREGLLQLRQDVRALPELFQVGLREFLRLVRDGRFDPAAVEHVLCHYSAEHFRSNIFGLLRDAGLAIDERNWFSNLTSKGNTGAASIFVALEERWRSGAIRPGDRVLLIVPESGRFSFSFAHLTCVAPDGGAAGSASAVAVTSRPALSPLGDPEPDDAETVRWMVLELAAVWTEFERRLAAVPLIGRIETGTATVEDYRQLLLNLRQQVVDGGRWIARAASNFSVELFPLRSAAIKHAAEEHRDYQLLEADFIAVGGEPGAIRGAEKNIGSEALSAFMFHQASQPDPVDLLGAMFVIEGLGTAKALGWAQRLQEQLGLRDDQVRFLSYHGANDDDHLAQLQTMLRSAAVTPESAARIVKTAKVVARLYVLQLEELDNV